MHQGPDNLSVIIGLSPRVDDLRRRLRRRGFAHVGVATCVAGLRRELMTGGHHLVLSCVDLDEPTLAEHGPCLQTLQSDADGFDAAWRCVGLVRDPALMRRAASVGCHLYLSDERRVAAALDRLRMHWTDRGKLPPKRSPAPRLRRRHIGGYDGRFKDRFGFLESG
jgi:hypothetical protein